MPKKRVRWATGTSMRGFSEKSHAAVVKVAPFLLHPSFHVCCPVLSPCVVFKIFRLQTACCGHFWYQLWHKASALRVRPGPWPPFSSNHLTQCVPNLGGPRVIMGRARGDDCSPTQCTHWTQCFSYRVTPHEDTCWASHNSSRRGPMHGMSHGVHCKAALIG